MISTCSNCKGHLFQIHEQSPSGSNFKMLFIQCTSCGNPVGVADYEHTGTKMDRIVSQIKSLEDDINRVQHSLRVINSNLEVIGRRVK